MKEVIEITHPKETAITLKIKNSYQTNQAITKKFGTYDKDWNYYGFINSLKYDRIIQLSNGKVILIRFKTTKSFYVKEILNYLKNLISHKETHPI